MRYEIEVRHHGVYMASHVAVAPDALTAINLIEREYGDPVWLEQSSLAGGDGYEHPIVVAHEWHGYSFEARLIEAEAEPIAADLPQRLDLSTLAPVIG